MADRKNENESRATRAVFPPVLAVGLALTAAGCGPNEPNNLAAMLTGRTRINEVEIQVWIADDNAERNRGLMFITPDELAPLTDGTPVGMLFVFDRPQNLAFWMKNTITPLDIAYINSDGTIVKTYTMAPLDTNSSNYESVQPAQYALEVIAGTFDRLGINEGDKVQLPDGI